MAEQQPIIIKKIKKGGHGHHGGAWKVAYADFVTAMMAFFLLLWLLNAVTQEQLEGIADYFAPASIAKAQSGSGGILGGTTISVEGAMQNVTSRATVTQDLPPPRAGEGGARSAAQEGSGDVTEDDAARVMREKEEEQFREAEEKLREAIENVPNLKQLAKSLLIDNTPEGLRIQIVDQEGLAMFPRGSAEMYLHTRKVLELVAKVVQTMPQKISLSGHTDATKYVTETGYSNFELSADRGNACRRVLLELGVPAERVARVTGMAANDPLLPSEPENPRNRRISIVLLRGSGQEGQMETLDIRSGAGPAGPAGYQAPSVLTQKPGGAKGAPKSP